MSFAASIVDRRRVRRMDTRSEFFSILRKGTRANLTDDELERATVLADQLNLSHTQIGRLESLPSLEKAIADELAAMNPEKTMADCLAAEKAEKDLHDKLRAFELDLLAKAQKVPANVKKACGNLNQDCLSEISQATQKNNFAHAEKLKTLVASTRAARKAVAAVQVKQNELQKVQQEIEAFLKLS